jgi:large subunit ribosomal protein L29
MPREKVKIHDMTVLEVEDKIRDMKKEIFGLRFRNAMRQLQNPLEIRYMKRDLARLESALSEHRCGIRPLVGESQPAPEPSAEKKTRSKGKKKE